MWHQKESTWDCLPWECLGNPIIAWVLGCHISFNRCLQISSRADCLSIGKHETRVFLKIIFFLAPRFLCLWFWVPFLCLCGGPRIEDCKISGALPVTPSGEPSAIIPWIWLWGLLRGVSFFRQLEFQPTNISWIWHVDIPRTQFLSFSVFPQPLVLLFHPLPCRVAIYLFPFCLPNIPRTCHIQSHHVFFIVVSPGPVPISLFLVLVLKHLRSQF